MLRRAIERQALKRFLALPDGLCNRIAQRVEKPEQLVLDSRLKLLLAAGQTKKPLNKRSIPEARAFYAELFQLMDVAAPATVTTRDHHMPISGSEIFLRSYHPSSAKDVAAMPGVLFMHGGGFTIGSVDIYNGIISWMAEQTQTVIVSLDYRLGPEFPYPTAAEDAIAAWRWMCANTDNLGLDPTRLGVMGDSAGGNLAAVVSQQSRRRGFPSPRLQCLIYPTLDLRMAASSISRYGTGFGLTLELIKWFRSNYLESVNQARELLASPGIQDELAGQPHTIMITATDPLRDEGLDYADKLRACQVPVLHLDYPQLVHGFMGMTGVLPAARVAMEEICQAIAERL